MSSRLGQSGSNGKASGSNLNPANSNSIQVDDPTSYRGANDEDEDEEEEDEDDDDPIIKTLPVYYSTSYLSSLTLLQYLDRPPRPDTTHPLLPHGMRPGGEILSTERNKIKAKFKPNSQHLCIEVPIEKHDDRWNPDLAEKLGAGVRLDDDELEGGKGKKKKKTQEEEEREAKGIPVERMEMSSLVVPDATNYVVGVIKDSTYFFYLLSLSSADKPLLHSDALHLSPVIQTYQLRPSLNYLDDLATLERRAKRNEALEAISDDSDAEISETEQKKLINKAVQVSVKQSADLSGGGAFGGGKSGGSGGGNGRAGAALFEPLRRMEGEAWIKLTQYPVEVSFRNFPPFFVSPYLTDL